MDRISFNQHTEPTRVVVREPRLIDPSARLKIADRRDTADLSRLATRAASAESVERLVAAKVSLPSTTPQASTSNANAIRFYTNPTDQNTAATMGAGSKLDVLA